LIAFKNIYPERETNGVGIAEITPKTILSPGTDWVKDTEISRYPWIGWGLLGETYLENE
jgi:hypothetical protein